MSDLSDDAVSEIRKITQEGLGLSTTFVDDGCRLAVVLAQRAVLAGLATDAEPDALKRMTGAAELNRGGHEAELGFKIRRCPRPKSH